VNLRFSGFGGQGVILCGLIFGKAAMLDGKNSIQTQSYGSASRGGLTKSDVCIEQSEIYDLFHDRMDVLVAMSQQSHDAYKSELISDGVLFYESDLVKPVERPDGRAYGIPATDIAFKEFGRKIIANMVMMGFVNEIAELVSHESLVRTIKGSVPPGTEAMNIKALERGGQLGAEQVRQHA
jgi:2-oxoglutarate ferredoxin oxidoreductase subunit gamma